MAYNFTEGGDYKVDATDLFYYQDEAGEPQPIHATVSTTHSAKVGGSLLSTKRQGRMAMGLEKRATFRGCSAWQKKELNAALRAVKNYLVVAIAYLTRQTRATAHYTTWFGPYMFIHEEMVAEIIIMQVYTLLHERPRY